MTPSVLTRRCRWCGARPRSPCRTPSNLTCEPHECRIGDSLGTKPTQRGRSFTPAAILDEIRSGRPTAQERAMQHDCARLDAWRVRVVCACLTRVQASRGALVADAILDRWTYPVALALAYGPIISKELEQLGLAKLRRVLIHDASTLAIHATNDDDVGELRRDYASEAVRLLVLRDLSFTPSDKALRAAHERMRASHVAPRVNTPPAVEGVG